MKIVIAILACLVLCSCAAGPVYKAKTQQESIKSLYDDRGLQAAYDKNRNLMQDLYDRFTRAKVDVYPQGIGVTDLRDPAGKRHPYLMVGIRPPELCFDVTKSKPDQRFSTVLTTSFEKYLALMRQDDLKGSDLEGLAFGIYWPVRDFSQCDTYGGYIEYAIIYLSKEDFLDVKDGNRSFLDVAQSAEIMASFDSMPAKSVRPVF